jgi:uncharacterized SAM-binding protein YcdF (DUF218 family)
VKFSKSTFKQILRLLILISGTTFFFLCLLAFTTLPYYARYWLGTYKGVTTNPPTHIILLGGAGIPSHDGLIRCYYAASLANRFPAADVIIAVPGDTTDNLSAPVLYREELLIRGVQKERIHFESTSHNTRQQALHIAESGRLTNDTGEVSIVTSPEHMFRAILCFEKAGLKRISGFPAFETSIAESDLYYKDSDLKGNKSLPGVGQDKQLRYQFWNHLTYEIHVIRECFAIAYYKARAWI